MLINMNQIFMNNMQHGKRCIDITKEVEIGPSPWEKHLAEKERQKTLPVVVDKEETI